MSIANITLILILNGVTSKAFLIFGHDYHLIFDNSIKTVVLNLV